MWCYTCNICCCCVLCGATFVICAVIVYYVLSLSTFLVTFVHMAMKTGSYLTVLRCTIMHYVYCTLRLFTVQTRRILMKLWDRQETSK